MFSSTCEMSPYLAYGMLIHLFINVYYLLMTKNIGTPFYDSLTDEQVEIKKKSAAVRRNIFLQGLFFGVLLVVLFRPFKSCNK